jgi:hypothetical protein
VESILLVVILLILLFITCLVGWQKCLQVIDLVAIEKNSTPFRTEQHDQQNGRTADCYMNSLEVQTPRGTQTLNSGNDLGDYLPNSQPL